MLPKFAEGLAETRAGAETEDKVGEAVSKEAQLGAAEKGGEGMALKILNEARTYLMAKITLKIAPTQN